MSANSSIPGGSSGYITTTGQEQLQNKEYLGGTASALDRFVLSKDTKSNLDALARKQGAIYLATDDNTVYLDDGSQLIAIGSGGLGGVNLLESEANAASGVTNWVSSGSTITVAKETTTIPLGSVRASAIKLTVGATPNAGDYVAIRFTMPTALKNHKLILKWFQQVSAYTTQAIKTELYYNASSDYSGAFTEVSLSSDDSSGDTYVPNANGEVQGITYDEGGNDYYELRFVVTASAAGNEIVYINDLETGPGKVAQGAIVGPWTDFTPSYTNLVDATVHWARWKQDGEDMLLDVMIQHDGTNSGTGTILLDIPESKSVRTTGRGITTTYGEGTFEDGGVRKPLTVVYNSDTSLRFSLHEYGTSPVVSYTPLSSQWSSNTDYLSFQARIPIAEWAGRGTAYLGTNDVEFAATSGTWDADSSTTVYGSSGAQIGGALTTARTKTITWQWPLQATDKVVLEMSTDGIHFVDASQFTNGTSYVINQKSTTNGATTNSGVFYYNSSSTQTVVKFERYAEIRNDDTPQSSWNASWYWRVRKERAGAASGFGAATNITPGLRVAEKQYVGGTDFTFSSTPAGWSLIRAVAVPYQTYDGAWRLQLNVVASITSATSASVTIDGITTKNVTNYNQPMAAMSNGGTYAIRCWFPPNSGSVSIFHGTANTSFVFSGDVELDSKPTWAD